MPLLIGFATKNTALSEFKLSTVFQINFFLVPDKTGPNQQKLSEVNLEDQENRISLMQIA